MNSTVTATTLALLLTLEVRAEPKHRRASYFVVAPKAFVLLFGLWLQALPHYLSGYSAYGWRFLA